MQCSHECVQRAKGVPTAANQEAYRDLPASWVIIRQPPDEQRTYEYLCAV